MLSNKLLWPCLLLSLLAINACSKETVDNTPPPAPAPTQPTEPPKPTLQEQIDSLTIGTSTLDDIKQLFGEPESTTAGATMTINGGRERTTHFFEYPSKGLSFSLIDDPWQLYSMTITNAEVTIRDLRIGDSLTAVRTKMKGEGEWATSDAQDWWALEFPKQNCKFGFERDPAQEKYPIKLALPAVVTRLIAYDGKVRFSR